MIIPLDDYPSGCWIYSDDLARLMDDGCPHTQDERQHTECVECGGTDLRMWVEDRQVYYSCPDCGSEDSDSFVDLYGCMSVPWGYLC